MITSKNMKSFKIKGICVTFRKYQPQIHQFSRLNIELAILCLECFLGICVFSSNCNHWAWYNWTSHCCSEIVSLTFLYIPILIVVYLFVLQPCLLSLFNKPCLLPSFYQSIPYLAWLHQFTQKYYFIFLDSKISTDSNCSHEIKRRLLLGKRAMTNLDSILKSIDVTLPTKVHLVNVMSFQVVMYGCEC